MPVLEHVAIDRITKEATESVITDGLPQINEILKDARNKLSALARLRCLPEVKHFKCLEDDDNLSSELVRRTALIQDVLRLIQLAEVKISQAFSLQAKFLDRFDLEPEEAKS